MHRLSVCFRLFLFLCCGFFGSLPLQAQAPLTFEYLDDRELWSKGRDAYARNNYPHAALYLFAYAQRYPGVLEDWQLDSDKQSLVAVLEKVTENLHAVASVSGDGVCDFKALDNYYYQNASPLRDPIEVDRSNVQTGEDPTDRQVGNNHPSTRPLVAPDGKIYQMIQLAGKTWLTQNLDLSVSNSWHYQNRLANGQAFGRLYTLEAAKKACASLGSGWRLPTNQDWKHLIHNYGGESATGFQLLTQDVHTGFLARLGGWRSNEGAFKSLGYVGAYWVSQSPTNGYYRSVQFSKSEGRLYLVSTPASSHRNIAYSCRCVKD